MGASASSPVLTFVMGVARSGTSAFVHTLNAHPEVCVGMERYKYLLPRIGSRRAVIRAGRAEENLFERERFFDFRPEDTNIVPSADPVYARLYEEMEQRWDHARVVGDKVNQLFRIMPALDRVYHQARYFYLLRDVGGVASSWNVRAQRTNDAWPIENDFRRAVPEWNEANRIVAEHLERSPASILVVPYERFYSGDPALLQRVFSFVSVDVEPEVERVYAEQASHYQRVVRRKEPTTLAGQDEYIAEHADLSTYRSLLAGTMSA